MTRPGAMLRGAVGGAATMYFLDPEVGRRRRALVRDKVAHWIDAARDELRAGVTDARNRARGVVANVRRIGEGQPMTDEAVADRIRRRFASLEHPDAIHVDVRDGHVRLSGPALAHDAELARRIAERVRGAREVVDEIQVHETPDVPALQEARRMRRLAEREPAVRLAAGVAAVATAAPIARRMGPVPLARLLAMSALSAAVYAVESARLRAIEHSRGPARGPGTPA